ncbi:ectonucleotide pyrophosphatase/phosphodiesterase [Brevundimonas sp. R86498]|uniref:ectonucleotide pyrophosphatase/phosphodiesterase n=1 Tax=Brevundimonas sp. R86498 TaxID=3093845 RepID=UPI0037C8F425
MSRVLLVCIALVLSACATVGAPAPVESRENRPLTILISIDGFHSDYLAWGATPTLSALAANGASGAMRPSFPSVTFPNHYTLVTGLHPDHHGIVGNAFIDPVLGRFSMARKETGWWDQAEPIWVTAERAGLTAGTMFWPGSETEIRGVRPTHWAPFDQTLTGDARVDRLLQWMDGSSPPDLATLYFDIVDTAGHGNGPDAEATMVAAAAVDASISRLLRGLEARGLAGRANLVIVSDHGMAPTAPERAIYLDDLIEASALQVIYAGAVAYLEPVPGREAEVEAALVRRHPHAECWTRATIPARFVLGSNPRVPSIVCLADTGWLLATRARPVTRSGGAHGYDNAAPAMSALFIAHGPAFRQGVRLDSLDSVDVQPLLGRLLGIAVPAGDGQAADTLPAMIP